MGKYAERHAFIAGGVLETGKVFNVICPCGGTTPITPKSTKGYGFSNRGGPVKIVDKLDVTCSCCNSPLTVFVVGGDPGYLFRRSLGGVQDLVLPQGSSSAPVNTLSEDDKKQIIKEIQRSEDE